MNYDYQRHNTLPEDTLNTSNIYGLSQIGYNGDSRSSSQIIQDYMTDNLKYKNLSQAYSQVQLKKT